MGEWIYKWVGVGVERKQSRTVGGQATIGG